jgi:photosynthetic reaction center cytochrome c subunit
MNTPAFVRAVGLALCTLLLPPLSAAAQSKDPAPPAPLAAPAPSAPGAVPGSANAAAPADAVPFDEAQALEALRRSIAGRESEPAETVFKNIQMLRGMPADRLLRVMQIGYSRSLGVTCTHCHQPDDWSADAKPEKKIARQMATLMRDVNEKLLPAIPELQSRHSVVNCTTCHRGQVKPALNLEAPKP